MHLPKIVTTGLVPLLLTCLPSALLGAPIDDAASAYKNYKIADAESLYRTIAADASASARDRGQAQTGLARISWLVDDDGSAAIVRLAGSLPSDSAPCAGALLYARILNEGGRAADVPDLLAPFSSRCTVLEPGVPLEVVHSHLLVAAALPHGSRSAALGAARRDLAALTPLAKASLDAARYAMDAGLLAGDGHAALEGWKSYFWLDHANRPTGFSQSSDDIARAFGAGAGQRGSDASAGALAQILVRAGFAQEAGWLASAHPRPTSGGEAWTGVQAYLKMRADLHSLVLAFNRKHARFPQADGKGIEEPILDVLRRGVRAAGVEAGADPWPALHELWDLHGQIGDLNGVSGIMIGHAVEDRTITIEQGRRTGRIRYIALDNMIENSFSGWLWDGAGGPGGFALDGTLIYQVRPGYVAGTLKALGVALGGPPRETAIQEAAEASRNDRVRADAGTAVPLPGLGKRLKLRAIDEVAAKARSQAADDQGFSSRFRRLWWDLSLQSSIVLHEGRHVLDQQEYTGPAALTGPESEFRGKLSEIGYSDLAPNALANVVGFEIDPASPHGQANKRIIAIYDGWIRAHAEEVAGYRGDEPAATQLDKLTDDQIRSIARSADPEDKPKQGI